MLIKNKTYRTRSGSVVAFSLSDGKTTFPAGTVLTFIKELKYNHPLFPQEYLKDNKYYNFLVVDIGGKEYLIPQAIMKLYPDEKLKDAFIDNAFNLMYERVVEE